MNINAMLLKDFYKAVHSEMLPKGMTKSVSYFTPRKSRVDRWPAVVNFGLQAFCKTWLIDHFKENFFDLPETAAVGEYKRIMDHTMGKVYDIEKIKKLHELGYLPVEVFSLPEGVLVPMHVPIFGITNTHPDFAWLPQALESLISAELWYPMICATVGHTYREIVNYWYDKTCDDDIPRRRALGNFDFRGDQGVDAALKAASGWCLSFVNSATVPVIPYLEELYNCDCTKEEVAFGAISTEHFVMCSNFAVDGDEITFLRRLLTELYPNSSFSCVSDSYDYWNVVKNLLPQLHDEIMAHNGCLLVRGDSGDCVEIVTETVFELWKQFGGTINKKGYKVLDPHVKALYGDSITVERAERIFKILEEHGFAAQNVSLGVGSFSMHCIEENGELKPFTRDTFSCAIKAVYCEINGEPKMICKDPITDRIAGNNFKKSQKGCCLVKKVNGEYTYQDEKTWDEVCSDPANEMRTVFINGEMIVDEAFAEIRDRLNGGKF